MTERTAEYYAALHVEIRCSRCDQLNWDSETGFYKETCEDDRSYCDISGEVTIDDRVAKTLL